MQHLPGFAPLAERYDGFVLDLWGVIHDGVNPYPGALDCLERLHAAGKRVALLSNAPRRAWAAQAMLRRMGIADTLYDVIMTSGEAAHLALRDRHLPHGDPWHAALGSRVYHIGPDRDRNVVHDLPLTVVEDPAGADFLLNTGPDDHRSPIDIAPFEDELRACIAAGLRMLCVNPDLEVLRGGERVICAGALAQRYAELGGEVRLLGKPDPAIYVPLLAELGVAHARVLAVGDALRTDIAGARAAGLDSCWVLGGIHGEALGGDHAAVEAEAAAAGLAPVASVPAFRW